MSELQKTLDRWTVEVAAETDLVAEIARARELSHELVERFARAVLVDLRRFVLPATTLFDNAKARLARSPQSLPVIELVNVLACCGVPLHREAIDLGRVQVSTPEERTRLAMLAVALDDLGVAARTFGGRAPYRREYPYVRDKRGALGHVIDAALQWWSPSDRRADVLPAWHSLLDHAEIDACTMLAIARLLEHRWNKQDVGFTAKQLHDLLVERAAKPSMEPPPRETLDRFPEATFLCGNEPKTMWRDRDRLISIANYVKTDDKVDLPAQVAYRAENVLELESIDHERGWVILERLPENVTWLPAALARRDDLRDRALDFGLSAGRLLATSARLGVRLTRARPELMWVRGREVVALSDRTTRLFDLPRHGFALPAFAMSYRAPELGDEERALAFTLATMVAEWATGRYPFPRGPDDTIHDALKNPHVPFGLDAQLEAVLDDALQVDPAKRMKLVDLVRKLEKFR